MRDNKDKKKTVLINVSYLVDLSEEEINNDNGILDKITNFINDKILHIDDKDILLEWSSTSSLILDSAILNCGKCSNCGQWTTDREKLNIIEGICNDATVDGKLLCDDCLPCDHKWAF